MITEENRFCHQVAAVYRLLKNLIGCLLLLAVVLALCAAETGVAQVPETDANSKVIATKLSGFGVPFKINSDDSAYIEVQLYLSRDAGKTWSFYGRKNTDEQEFRFEADEDGEYWFSLKTLSRDRRLLPEGDPQPELKILVDTVKPKLNVRFQADPAGRVICRWQAIDKNIAPASIKLLYQPVLSDGTVKPWQTVPVNLGGVARNGVYADQVGWWPETTEATVNVAVEIADVAGNSVRQTRKVNLPATAWRTRNSSTALPNLAAATNQQTSLKPTTDGAGTKLPNQPDWAYPGYKSPEELLQNQGNQPTDPNPPANPAGLEKTADHDSGKPAGVICENGVCRLAPKQDMPSRVDDLNLPPAPTGSGTPTGAGTPTGPPSPRQTVAKQSSPPIANKNRIASTKPLLLPMIGEEYAAPPTPAGYVARRQQPITSRPPVKNQPPVRAADAANQQGSSSINWESEKESWKPKGRMQPTGPAPVRPFDATITPLPTRQSPVPPPATNVPSNPGKMFFEGDKVIGQSSTMGRSNQYRGQRTTIGSLPSPTLLPELGGESAAPPFPKTNSTPFQESPQLGSMRQLPPKKFSNAGFDRTDAPKSGRFNTQRTSQTGARDSVMSAPIAGTTSGGLDRQTQSLDSSTSADYW